MFGDRQSTQPLRFWATPWSAKALLCSWPAAVLQGSRFHSSRWYSVTGDAAQLDHSVVPTSLNLPGTVPFFPVHLDCLASLAPCSLLLLLACVLSHYYVCLLATGGPDNPLDKDVSISSQYLSTNQGLVEDFEVPLEGNSRHPTLACRFSVHSGTALSPIGHCLLVLHSLDADLDVPTAPTVVSSYITALALRSRPTPTSFSPVLVQQSTQQRLNLGIA